MDSPFLTFDPAVPLEQLEQALIQAGFNQARTKDSFYSMVCENKNSFLTHTSWGRVTEDGPVIEVHVGAPDDEPSLITLISPRECHREILPYLGVRYASAY